MSDIIEIDSEMNHLDIEPIFPNDSSNTVTDCLDIESFLPNDNSNAEPVLLSDNSNVELGRQPVLAKNDTESAAHTFSANNNLNGFYYSSELFYENLATQTKMLNESCLCGFDLINEPSLSLNDNNSSNEFLPNTETGSFNDVKAFSGDDLDSFNEKPLDQANAFDNDSNLKATSIYNTNTEASDSEKSNKVIINHPSEKANQIDFVYNQFEIKTQSFPSTSDLQSNQSRKRKLEKESSDEIDSSENTIYSSTSANALYSSKETKTEYKKLKSKTKAYLNDFNSFIKKRRPDVELELIDKYFREENLQSIQDMKKYFEYSSKKMNNKNFLKKLEDILECIKNKQSEVSIDLEDASNPVESNNSNENHIFKSELKSEYKKIFEYGKNVYSIISNPNQYEKNEQFFSKIEEAFQNIDGTKTFSEGISEIIFILKSKQEEEYLELSNKQGSEVCFLENQLRKKEIEKYSKGYFSNEAFLYLIDDLIIKVQYDVLLISYYFNHLELHQNIKKDFSLVYAFILKQKIFIEKIRNGLGSSNDKSKLEEIVKSSNESFGYSNNSLVITHINQRILSCVKFIEGSAMPKRFLALLVKRLKILGQLTLQVKKMILSSSTFDFYCDLPYALLKIFFNS